MWFKLQFKTGQTTARLFKPKDFVRCSLVFSPQIKLKCYDVSKHNDVSDF